METVGDLVTQLGLAGLTVRTLVAVAGVLLLVAGSRNYKAALVLPAAALGAVLCDTVLGPAVLGGIRLVAGLVGAIAVGTLAAVLESIAVRLAGVLPGGGVALAVWPAIMGGGTVAPWWVPLGGGLVGLLMFPGLYRSVLRVVVPLLGGLIVAHAAGHPGDPLWVLGLGVASFVLDAVLRGPDEA